MRRNFKVVLLGNAGVGKSTLLRCIAYGPKMATPSEPTIGAAFFVHKTPRDHTYHIWDTAGAERFHALLPLYIRGAHIALFVYDVTDRASLADVRDRWYKLARTETVSSTLFVLAGNKVDAANRAVRTDEGEALARDMKALFFAETSALDGTGVHTLMERIDTYMVQQRGVTLEEEQEETSSTIIHLKDEDLTRVGRWYHNCTDHPCT